MTAISKAGLSAIKKAAMIVIANINTKGGVGKTVSAVNLAGALVALGFRVLLIDVDLQHGLSRHFGLDGEDYDGLTTMDVLIRGAAIEAAAVEVRPDLWVVPANATMERVEVELAAVNGGEVRLRRAMRAARDSGRWDFCLVDCPSGYGAVTRNALLASSLYVIPINSEPWAIQPAHETEIAATELADLHDHELQLLGVLITRMRNSNSARAVEMKVVKDWGEGVFDVRIRQTEKVNELAARQCTANDVSPSMAGSVLDDHALLAEEVIARCLKTIKQPR